MSSLEFTLLVLFLLTVTLAGLGWRRARQEQESLRQERSRLQLELADRAGRLTELEHQLAAWGQATLETVVVVDAERRVIFASEDAVHLFQRGTEFTRTGASLIAFARSAELDQLAVDSLTLGPAETGMRDELDRQILIADRPYRARAAAFENGTVLVLRDVSELQRLGRARRDFVANVSHEIRTPLTSIRLLLDGLLSESTRDPAEEREALHKIGVEVLTLQQMAQELLDLAQIESGRALARMVPTPVEKLVTETVERLRPQSDQKRLSVRVAVDSGLVALADAEQVNRALGNLLHNAIKFSPEAGEIRVRASAAESDVLFEVSDNGPGISADDLPRVFERFYRGDRSRGGSGTGLGLAVAKHVAEAHGGKIWVESVGRPGKGATFRFTLPTA